MIDYAHIPPHLRLSDRQLIVDGYPGGSEWWCVQLGRRDKPRKRRVRDEAQKRRNAELAAKYRKQRRLQKLGVLA